MGNTVAIEKAYQLRAIGGKEVYNDLDRIKRKFEEIRAAKIALNDQMASVKDTKEYQELAGKLKNVEAELKKVRAEMERLTNTKKEQEALEKRMAAQAKQASADTLANAKAATEAQRQQTEVQKQETQKRVQALHDEKTAAAEAQKQLKQLQLQRAQARAAQPAAATGSYNDIAAQYRMSLAHYKATVDLNDAAALKVAQEDLMRLKTQLDAFNRSLTQDKVLIGEYTSGVMNAFKKMGLGHLISDQVNTAKASLHTLNTEFDHLKQQLDQIRATGVGSLDAVERQLVENRQAAMELQGSLDRVQHELQGVGGVGTQVTQALRNEFANLRTTLAQFIIGYMGFQQLINGIQSSVRMNYDLSDSFADIKNRIKGTNEEVATLVDSLRELDTRSSLASLVDIAAIVSKKGVAKEEIAGVTQAIDGLMVALNGEMGDAKETVSTLVKLVNVYSEDKHVTADNINAIGGAIAALSNSGVATGPFLVDFAERMAGIRGITGLTIDKVLGLGAAMEELGQRTETSSTALSQIVIKLFTDAEKYAAMLGKPLEEYRYWLERDVLGTFVNVSEALKGNAAEMETFFENSVDMHLRGARAISVIGDIAGNIDYARKRMSDATVALHKHGIVADMAAEKQNNLAANVDRLRKSWELLATSKGAQATISAFVNVLRVAIDNLGLISAAILLFNARLILNKAQLVANAAWTRIYTVALQLQLEATLASAAGFNALWTVMATNPMTMIIGLGALLWASMNRMNAALTGTTDALKEKNKQMRISSDITQRGIAIASDEISRLKILNQTLLANNVALDSKSEALEELQSKYPAYQKILDAETASVKDLTAAYKEVEKQIRANAELKAAQELVKEKQGEADTAVKLRKKLEYNFLDQADNTGDFKGKRYIAGMSDDEKAILEQAAHNVFKKYKGKQQDIMTPSWLTDQFLIYSEEAYKPLMDEIDAIIKQREDVVTKYAERATPNKTARFGSTYNENIKRRADIEADIAKVQEIRDNYTEGTKDYVKYTQDIQKLLAEWYSAGGRKPEQIAAELEKVKADIKLQKHNELEVAKLRRRREALYTEIQNSLKIHDTHAGKKGRQEPDFTNTEVSTESNLTKYQAMAAEMRLKREMDAQKDIYENEQGNLFKRLSAHGAYVTLQGQQMQTAADAEVKVVQDKLDKIAELEKKKKLTTQEKRLVLQKQALVAELDSINETTKAKTEQAAREAEKTYAGILTGSLGRLAKEAGQDIDEALAESYDRAAQMRRQIYESDISPYLKQKRLADLELDSRLDTDKISLAGNEQLQRQTEADLAMLEEAAKHNAQLLGAEIAYQEKLKKLKQEHAQIEDQIREDKFAKELAAAEQQQQIYDTIKDGAINSFQQIGSAYMQMMQQQADVQMQREQRSMEWNRRVTDAHTQSLREKQANEAAYNQAQDEMERRRLQKNRQIALTQMAIDYAVGVMKIWSAKAVVAPVAIAETAVLTGVYMAKVAMMASQKYERGGVIGGRSHANGGTPITIEAERDELAIINKQSARDNRTVTMTGTPRQIASGVNALGGGVDFAPGWTSTSLNKYMGKGWQANGVRVPQFIGQHYVTAAASRAQMAGAGAAGRSADNDQFAAMHAEIMALTGKVGDMQVILNPHQVAGYNYEYSKSVNVGTI